MDGKLTQFQYQPSGVCSQWLDIEVEDGIIRQVSFTGGCHGNTQGIARLVRGMPVDEVIERLEGIRCGDKGTSCPDQLARALRQWREGQREDGR